jgi:hypothetical protein
MLRIIRMVITIILTRLMTNSSVVKGPAAKPLIKTLKF